MFEVTIRREKRTQTRAGSYRTGLSIAALVANQRQHFVNDIAIVAREQFGFEMRWHLFVEQAVTIDAIDRIGAQLAVVEKLFDGVDEVEPFVFEIVGGSGREHQKRRPRMSVSYEGHFHVQVVAVPRCCTSFHRGPFCWEPFVGNLSAGESRFLPVNWDVTASKAGREIFSQIFAERKFGQRVSA